MQTQDIVWVCLFLQGISRPNTRFGDRLVTWGLKAQHLLLETGSENIHPEQYPTTLFFGSKFRPYRKKLGPLTPLFFLPFPFEEVVLKAECNSDLYKGSQASSL